VPAVPRLGVMAAAIAVAALAFFFLPGLLGLGTGEQAAPSSSPSLAPSQSIEPTAPPSPTATIYRIKSGDTLLKIAKANGITIEQLLAANPDIKNPNRIVVGQEITIPPPEEAIPEDFGGSAAPSEEPAP
jgi:LysM repeat protein